MLRFACAFAFAFVSGYTVRTAVWRYTAWFHWDATTLTPDWAGDYAEELYNHTGDHSYEMDEYENVSNRQSGVVVPASCQTVAVHIARRAAKIHWSKPECRQRASEASQLANVRVWLACILTVCADQPSQGVPCGGQGASRAAPVLLYATPERGGRRHAC